LQVCLQQLLIEIPGLGEGAVKAANAMAFGEDEAVAVRVREPVLTDRKYSEARMSASERSAPVCP
jgi:hypothetical protein